MIQIPLPGGVSFERVLSASTSTTRGPLSVLRPVHSAEVAAPKVSGTQVVMGEVVQECEHLFGIEYTELSVQGRTDSPANLIGTDLDEGCAAKAEAKVVVVDAVEGAGAAEGVGEGADRSY